MKNIDDKFIPAIFKYMDLEKLTFDELITLMNATRTHHLFCNHMWVRLHDYITRNKIKTKVKYRNYVFKGIHRNGVLFTDKMISDYNKDMVEIVDEQSGAIDFDDCHIILRHRDSNRYMKISGEYTSYNGNEYYGDWVEVKPVEIVTVEYSYL